MRNLDANNFAAKSTKFAFTVSLIIPLFMGSGAWALASGAAPKIPLQDNCLEIFGLVIMALAVMALPIPYIFRWGWETKYFGASMFSFGTGSIIGIYPVLCIAIYGSLPFSIRLSLALLEFFLIIWWCSRFVNIYKSIYQDRELFSYIYTEEPDAVYYLQQADKKVIEKIMKFDLFPSSKFFVLSFLSAFAMVPFSSPISKFVGVPFTHVFLAVSATPINLMFLGLSTKMWLVFYLYPMKIKRDINKPIYVDISSRPIKYVSHLR